MTVQNLRVRVLPRVPPELPDEVELQTTATHIQWKLASESEWTNLIALSELTGEQGPNIELQTSGGFIQWRVEGSGDEWEDLVSLTAITGPPPGLSVGTVTTLDPGQDATVGIDGSPASGYTLDFGIPRGSGMIPADEAVTRPKMITYLHKGIPPTPEEYGAVGDGTTDDTTAVQNAIDAGNRLNFDAFDQTKVYRVTAPLTIDKPDYTIDGNAGVDAGAAKLLIDHAAGEAIWIKKGSFRIRGLWCFASDTRNGTAIGSGNIGLKIGVENDYTATGYMEHCLFQRHPDEGILGVGLIAGLYCLNVRSQYNRHHGWRFSDGVAEGYGTPFRPGIISLIHCRSEENGGNALHANTANPAYRILTQQWECYNNAWNSEIGGLENYDIVVAGQNLVFDAGASGEPLGISRTTLSNGDPCYAKEAKSGGFMVKTGTRDFELRNWRFSDNSQMVQCDDGSIIGLSLSHLYTDATLPVAVALGTNTQVADINIPKTGTLTVPIRSKSTLGGKATLAGVEYELYGDPSNPHDVHFQPRGIGNVTIAGGSAEIKTGTVRLTGEGGAQDTLSNIYFATYGSQYHRDGTQIRMLNKNAYSIFVGILGNIRTKTGAQVTLDQNDGITVVADGGVYYEV